MKKTTRVVGIIAPLILLAGAFMKTGHRIGANALLIVGAAASILFFVLLIISFKQKKFNNLGHFAKIMAAGIIILMLTAFLFSILHWQGASKLMWIADAGAFLACILFFLDGFLEKDPGKAGLKFITAYFILFLVIFIVLFG